jgi:hypothetical protein
MTIAMRYLFLVFIVFSVVTLSYGQDKPLSPLETVTAEISGVETTIIYCRPSARGRVMIGGKEPFGQVWRTGANAATTIEFDKDVLIEGKKLPAGKYSLFTIPGGKEWTIIFNKIQEQWGAYNYNQAEDALRVKVTRSKPKAFVETFTIAAEKNRVTLMWENYLIFFSVKRQ